MHSKMLPIFIWYVHCCLCCWRLCCCPCLATCILASIDVFAIAGVPAIPVTLMSLKLLASVLMLTLPAVRILADAGAPDIVGVFLFLASLQFWRFLPLLASLLTTINLAFVMSLFYNTWCASAFVISGVTPVAGFHGCRVSVSDISSVGAHITYCSVLASLLLTIHLLLTFLLLPMSLLLQARCYFAGGQFLII